jgi:hypothetical protein
MTKDEFGKNLYSDFLFYYIHSHGILRDVMGSLEIGYIILDYGTDQQNISQGVPLNSDKITTLNNNFQFVRL